MTSSSAALSVDTDSSGSTSTSTRIKNPQTLQLVRIIWVIFALMTLGLTIIALPTLFSPQLCNPNVACFDGIGRITQTTLDLLTRMQISASVYNIYYGVIALTAYSIFILAGWILFWQRSDDVMALILAASFVAFYGISPVVGSLSAPIGFVFILIFPTGRFQPRWTITLAVIMAFLISLSLWIDTSGPVFLLIFVTMGVVIYRYRRLMTPIQRLQSKWLLLGMGLLFSYWITLYTVILPVLQLLHNDNLTLFFTFANPVLATLAQVPILAGMWIAVTRYRLFELNLVINRSLVYGAVTMVLILVFAGVIALVSTITQQGSSIGLVIAAVAAGGLFNPLRKGIQSFVDHRVYGLRYDLNEVAAAQQKPEIKNPGMYTGRMFGDYEVLGVLGKGGMGEVYQGFGNGQTVAIKVLPEDLAKQDELRKRFQREVDTLSKLDHPNIVKLYGSGVSEDQVHYLTMELIEGEELTDVAKQGIITDFEALHDWMQSIASALGLVHRDLKPSNIMLRQSADGETREAVLMDFGIARIDNAGTRLTGSGAIGTIDYMAPEQILASGEVDGRADVYALGVVLYELLTGTRPFKGGPAQVMFAHLQQPVTDPRDLNPELPKTLAKAALKALEKKPEDRFQSAGELAAALA